jgi:hypothetical protein
MKKCIETSQMYRAINEEEMQELIELNGKDIVELLCTDGELNFILHEHTKWDSNSNGWPKVLLGNRNSLDVKRPLIIEVNERITGLDTTENLKATSSWINLGYPFQAHAIVTREVKARIFAVDIELIEEEYIGTSDNRRI